MHVDARDYQEMAKIFDNIVHNIFHSTFVTHLATRSAPIAATTSCCSNAYFQTGNIKSKFLRNGTYAKILQIVSHPNLYKKPPLIRL